MKDWQQIEIDDILGFAVNGGISEEDADRLQEYIDRLQTDIANLSAVLEDALVFEVGVTFQEEDNHEQGTCDRLPVGAFSA